MQTIIESAALLMVITGVLGLGVYATILKAKALGFVRH